MTKPYQDLYLDTIPCPSGGYCEFTKPGADDMHCAKCDGLSRHAILQGALPRKRPDDLSPGPGSSHEE